MPVYDVGTITNPIEEAESSLNKFSNLPRISWDGQFISDTKLDHACPDSAPEPSSFPSSVCNIRKRIRSKDVIKAYLVQARPIAP